MFEVTESVLVDESDRATETVDPLAGNGVRLAIDDFGAGYCSLSYLQRHPVDLLKIDRTFVDEFGREPRGNTLARTILQMADSLELLTVAEGIETTGQLRELRRLGCDLGQGYLLSRPLEAAATAASLRVATPSSSPADGGDPVRSLAVTLARSGWSARTACRSPAVSRHRCWGWRVSSGATGTRSACSGRATVRPRPSS